MSGLAKAASEWHQHKADLADRRAKRRREAAVNDGPHRQRKVIGKAVADEMERDVYEIAARVLRLLSVPGVADRLHEMATESAVAEEPAALGEALEGLAQAGDAGVEQWEVKEGP